MQEQWNKKCFTALFLCMYYRQILHLFTLLCYCVKMAVNDIIEKILQEETKMTRDQAYEILTKYMKGEHYITHSLAVEAIMRGLAKRLAPDDVEYWGIAGLLHDLDEEQCDWQHDLSVHGPTSVEILKKEGIDDPILFGAICAHNPKSGVKAKTKIQYALLAADPMSGFLKAVAQIYPDKKIASVKRKSVLKRFNEARFAKGANRDYMESIEFTGLMLEDLIDIGLEEMCAISDELGL